MKVIGKPVVAVVDDDPRVLESLEDLFESAGYVVRAFSSGKALLTADLSSMDCLITDIGMPGMNGFELLHIVKRALPKLPVFLLTGRHDINRHRAMSEDISGFLRKPFSGPDLLAAVDHALRSTDIEDDDDR
jgi:FixJ family two-component response regulator